MWSRERARLRLVDDARLSQRTPLGGCAIESQLKKRATSRRGSKKGKFGDVGFRIACSLQFPLAGHHETLASKPPQQGRSLDVDRDRFRGETQPETWQRASPPNLEESNNGVGRGLAVSGDANWFLAQLQPFQLHGSAICGHRASQDGLPHRNHSKTVPLWTTRLLIRDATVHASRLSGQPRSLQ
jgi:hypothetical protein